MNKIRKGDLVVVLSGKDKGRQGTVLAIDGDKVTVELTPYDLSRARIVFRAK